MKIKPYKRIPAFYLRSASKNRKQIKRQKDKYIDYAKENSIKKYKFYIDNGYSGTTLDRPKIKRLLADVEKGKISAVVVTSDNRLLRIYYSTQYPKLLNLYELFAEHNVEFTDLSDIESQDENFNEKLERLKRDWAKFQKHSYLYASF